MSFMLSAAAHSISQSHNQTLLAANLINSNNYNSSNSNNNNNHNNTNNICKATTNPIDNTSTSTMVDTGDTNYEIKTEFYTREGMWKQVPNGEYIRQLQQQQQQQQSMSPQYQQMHGGMNGSSANVSNGNQQSSMGGGQTSSSNDSVKIGVFRYSKRSIFKKINDDSSTRTRRKSFRTKLKCFHCQREQSDDDDDDDDEDEIVNKDENNSQENSDYDDDDDVIFTKVKNADSDYDGEDDSSDNDDGDDDTTNQLKCKYCKQFLRKKRNDECDNKRLASAKSLGNENLKSLDLMLFNYAREIYFYEFNPVKSKVSYSFIL